MRECLIARRAYFPENCGTEETTRGDSLIIRYVTRKSQDNYYFYEDLFYRLE